MKRCLFLLVFAALSLALVAGAKPKKQKATLPAAFDHAQYVHVEAMNGDSLDPDVLPEDRQAIGNVEQGLRDWDRYSIALRRDQADLVFVVRKGRTASVIPHVVGLGGHPQDRSGFPQDSSRGDSAPGVGVGAEAGPADDMLSIYMVNPSGSLIGPIWSYSLKGGLDMPAQMLLKRIRQEVETAYPR